MSGMCTDVENFENLMKKQPAHISSSLHVLKQKKTLETS